MDTIEELFLCGKFQEALSQANKYLEQHQEQDNAAVANTMTTTEYDSLKQPDEEEKADVVQSEDLVTLHCPRFQNDYIQNRILSSNQQRIIQLKIHYKQTDTDFDRAGAIVLQCWYEISKIIINENDEETIKEGLLLLKPFCLRFLTNDCNNNESTMSLNLFIIFVQFLYNNSIIHEIHVAIELIGQLLYKIIRHPQSNDKPVVNIQQCQYEIFHELVLLLFTELLLHYDLNTTQEFLQRFKEPHSKDDGPIFNSKYQYQLSAGTTINTTRKRVIQECLCFCNTDDGNWPIWLQETFQECRQILQDMLRDIYHNNNDNTSNITSTNGMMNQIINESKNNLKNQLIKPSSPMSFQQIIDRIQSWIKEKVLRNYPVDNERELRLYQRRKRYIQMVLVLALLLAYKSWRRNRQHQQRRRKITMSPLLSDEKSNKSSNRLLDTVLWKPLMEILEAFGIF